jgi:hypothetical protein
MLESQKAITELSPVRTEYLQVNYAKASDLAGLIQSKGKSSLLSDRGSVSVDERTNTLLLADTAERLADIRRLVSTLDIPVKQVLIEARIVIVNDTFSRELGVKFGSAFVGNYGSDDGLMWVGNNGLNSATGNRGPIISPNGPGGVGVDGNSVSTAPAPDRYLVNLPIANPALKLAMTLLDSDYVVDLEITAAQREGRGEVISAPRVITANGQEAYIEQGREIPYQESASSGATTTQFKKAVLSLTVTPQITPDDRLILDLKVTKDSVRRPVRAERHGRPGAQHRHPRDHDAGAGERWADRRAGRYPRDGQPRRRDQGAVPWRRPRPRSVLPQQVEARGEERAADLRDPEDPARRRQHLLTPAPADGTMRPQRSCGRIRFGHAERRQHHPRRSHGLGKERRGATARATP